MLSLRPFVLLKQYGGAILCNSQSLHTSALKCQASTSLLSKLRKSTGFSITKCKNALDKFEGDIKKAEVWLREQAQKEGWAKATKLQDRPMSQGLVGIIVEGRSAAMVEINCETDFVAKNQKFRNLVTAATQICMQHGKEKEQPAAEIHFDREAFGSLQQDGQSLSDLVALEVGNIGENMRARRGVYLQVAEGKQIGSYVHNAETKTSQQKCVLGKYGSLVSFSQTETEGVLDSKLVGDQLALHVVGMNPSEIGVPDPVEEVKEAEEGDKKKKNKKKKKKKIDDDESRMLHQQFIGNDKITVETFLEQNSVCLEGFIRYECGQQLPEDEVL